MPSCTTLKDSDAFQAALRGGRLEELRQILNEECELFGSVLEMEDSVEAKLRLLIEFRRSLTRRVLTLTVMRAHLESAVGETMSVFLPTLWRDMTTRWTG